jgi:hypothetical protein
MGALMMPTLAMTRPLIPATALCAFSSVALEPSEDRRVIDIQAALLHHLGKIAGADRALAISAHADEVDLSRKSAALAYRHHELAP